MATEIRTATPEDLDAIMAVETECFPPAEAASRDQVANRIAEHPDDVWLLFDGDELASSVTACATDHPDITDENYADATLHTDDGDWQKVLSVITDPDHRSKGYASKLLEECIASAKKQGKAGLVLACKDHKIGYYEKLGFVSEGISESDHGGATWYQMRLTFAK